MQELDNIEIKTCCLALQKQLINLKIYNVYLTQIDFILSICETYDKLSLDEINIIQIKIKQILKQISADLTLILTFKQQIIYCLKTILNILIQFSITKIINNINDF